MAGLVYIFDGIALSPDTPEENAIGEISRKMSRAGIPIRDCRLDICKKSVDARKKSDIKLVYSVRVAFDGGEGEKYRQKLERIGARAMEIDSLELNFGKADMGARPLVVGMGPAGMFCALLLAENGTVTVAHSRTKDLKEVASRADILVVAVGKPKMITADYVKEGAVVIDVGINRNADNKLCGDVDYEQVAPKCSAITPVPGGVGPMTIAMLMKNCLESVGKQ